MLSWPDLRVLNSDQMSWFLRPSRIHEEPAAELQSLCPLPAMWRPRYRRRNRGEARVGGGVEAHSGEEVLAHRGLREGPTPAQDGKFELKELDPGTYDLTIRGADFATMVKRDVKVESGKTVDLGTITVYRGRKITGRVVDKRGKGVGGAQVKVGEMLFFSDDQKPNTEEDDPAEQLGGMRSTVTDEDGRFSIIGIAAKATSVAADHPTAGRSASVAVPEGATDPAPVTLALRGFGSITGKVVQKGKPLSGVSVTHTQKGAGAQISAVQTDDDGVFTMKKVPEGSVTLQAMQQKMMAMKSTTVTVQVTSGNETKVTIDVPVGQVTLTVTPKPAAGAKVDAAQLFLFSGAQVAANGKQLMDAFLAGGAQGMELWFGPGKPPVAFRELVPGSYSVCALPITGDMNDQQLMQRINENAAILKVYCKQVKVTPAPVEQTFSVELPSMDPLPAPANDAPRNSPPARRTPQTPRSRASSSSTTRWAMSCGTSRAGPPTTL